MSVRDTQHCEIRAARLSIDRSREDGVTLTVEAGELRLRFYIDGQWSDLLQQIQTGEGELGEMVPFRMKPIPTSSLHLERPENEPSEERVFSTRTIGAHPIPGLSGQKTTYKTPLWKNAFPSLRSEEEFPEGQDEDGD
mgnify:CR=1 FL=1